VKILLVGWGFPPNIDGGLDIHVERLFRCLQEEKGVDVTLALPKDRAPTEENIKGLDVSEGEILEKSRNMSSKVAELAQDFDVVHTHDWFSAEAGFKSKKYSDCKWVSTIHSLNSDRGGEKGGEVEKLEKVAVKEADKVISVSSQIRENIEESYGVDSIVIRNGSSSPPISGSNIKENLEIDGDMIFFVGRHAEQKGVKNLIYGFKKYRDGGGSAELVLGGKGHLSDSLKDFAKMLEVEEHIFFEGFVPREELGDYYSSADVFMSPSRSEPFGLTITEALECGTPVVATDSGVEEILPKNTLVHIEPNSDSIAEGIKKGLRQDKEIKSIERSWKDMSEEIIEVYNSI